MYSHYMTRRAIPNTTGPAFFHFNRGIVANLTICYFVFSFKEEDF